MTSLERYINAQNGIREYMEAVNSIHPDMLMELWETNQGEFSFDNQWEYDIYLKKLTDYYKDYKLTLGDMKRAGRDKIRGEIGDIFKL